MCFANSQSNDAKTLAVPTEINYPYINVTVEFCLNECDKHGGYDYAGLVAGVECCTCRLFDELSSPDQTLLLRV